MNFWAVLQIHGGINIENVLDHREEGGAREGLFSTWRKRANAFYFYVFRVVCFLYGSLHHLRKCKWCSQSQFVGQRPERFSNGN
ncbi:hypothetical protein RHMOL_Rhmol08G0301500 [Rhododendron molle]|uniref:Uncharacterized protein n=2 Tax=Rhododendron molle TaxID=49168 RepID=A0ACC0MTX7_RHOML|nr:hypothetical protein RHMOL_Rhmol08G0301500 [Rhododendron molle]KAI8544496.1 hypothetical protein RHMOL_Rhmol08G0301500 [Rhododendron molle]